MAGLKSLAKDTAIYGLSSIVGRFLNYMLVPLYTAVLPASTGGYGVVSNVYAFTALMLVLLTFGMETGFFRFANKSGEDPMKVYANSLLSVGGVSLIFVLLCLLFLQPISNLLDYGDHPEFIAMMAVVVALDSFQCIPFAYLRYKKRPVKFAAIKLLSIIGGIGLNLFFLLVCPWLNVHCPATISWFYDPDYLVGYIFISNLIISVVQMFFFIPELTGFAYKLDRVLLKRMVVYSFPVLILGLVGILNQTVDKMIYPFLFEDRQEGLVQLGIYAATSKIAMVMAMFTQAFRYAYEPFVFGKDREGDNRKMYAAAMKYFLIFSLLAFLAVMFYLDLLRYLVAKGYWEGLGVVAIVMLAEICKGIYFNLSFWYKLTDKTYWGAYFSVIGCVIIVVLNILFVPVYGYLASAWASVAGYAVILLLSYWIGQKEYPIRYDLKSLGLYVLLAAVLYVIGEQVPIPNLVRTVIRRPFTPLSRTVFDRSERLLPVIHRFFIDSVYDASARKTNETGSKLFQILNNIFTEYGFPLIPGIRGKQGNDIYLKLSFRHRLNSKHSALDVLFRFQFARIFCPVPILYIHFDHIAHLLSQFVN